MEPTRIDVRVTTGDGQEWSCCANATPLGTAASASLPRRLVTNLAAITSVGLIVVLLLAVYTDAFSAVAAALGLGGVFIWVGFLKNMLTDDRKAQMQAWFESAVLMSKATPAVVLIVFGGVAAYLGRNGVVVLDSTGDRETRLITVRAPDNTIVALVRLAPNAQTKISLAAFPPKEYRVEVRDLPFASVRLRPFSHRVMYMPASFEERPLTIIRVDPALAMTENFAMAVSVMRDRQVIAHQTVSLPSLQGRPMWVGCNASVPVPRHVIDLWRLDFASSNIPAAWEKPPGALFDTLVFRRGDTVTVELLNGRTVVDRGSVVVQGGEFLQGTFKEIYLK